MKSLYLPFVAVLLAAGLAAQAATPSTLTAGGRFGIEAEAVNKDTQIAPAGPILRPVSLEARDLGASRNHFAYARMQVGLHAGNSMGPRPGLNLRAGGYLRNVGNVAAPDPLSAQAQTLRQGSNFEWVLDTGNELNGKVLVFFEGHIFGGATITANINRKLLDPAIREGRFALKDEIPVAKAKEIRLVFGMVANTGSVKDGKANYNGHLYFYFVPEPVLPSFKWEVPRQRANCAAGNLVDPGTITPGVPFDIALSGATDIGKVAAPHAMLFIGTNDTNHFFIPLPFNLTGIGGFIPGSPDVPCFLFIDMQVSRLTRIDANGEAKLPFMLPRNLFFRDVYFQWAYTSDATRLGLVFSDYARLVRQ